jgi:hypothetical protein
MHTLVVWRREACSATQLLQLAVVGVQQSASTVYKFLRQQQQRSIISNSVFGWLQNPQNHATMCIGPCAIAGSRISAALDAAQ